MRLEEIKIGYKEAITFKINQEKLQAFSSLVKDYSSLHVDESFSRRTKYKSRVVQGMLLFGHIANFDIFNIEGYAVHIHKLELKFSKPVFLEEDLEMNLELVDKDSSINLSSDNFKVKITARTKSPAEVVMEALVTMKLIAAENLSQEKSTKAETINAEKSTHTEKSIHPSSGDAPIELLSGSLEEANLNFEEMEVGMTRAFSFSVLPEHLNLLRKIIRPEKASLSLAPNYSPNLKYLSSDNHLSSLIETLSLSLFSTLVGMSMPGRNATFLSMETELLEPLLLNENYVLKGEVLRKSAATRTIQLGISIENKSSIQDQYYTKSSYKNEIISPKKYLAGKIMVMVNPAVKGMAALSEIKEKYFDFNLKNKVVLITGASRGIGATTAKLFSLHGAKVIINYCYSEKEAQKIVDEIKMDRGEAVAIKADVSQAEEVKEMVRSALEKYEQIDILVNNAARDFLPQDFLQLRWEEIQKDIEVNIKGAFNCCQAVLPSMIKNKSGAIINVYQSKHGSA